MNRTGVIWISLLFLTCATASRPISTAPELQLARSRYERAAADPDMRTKAPAQLAEAEQALARAQAAWERGADPTETALFAYLAERHVLMARVAASRGPGEVDPIGASAVDTAPNTSADLADLQARALEARAEPRGLVVTLGRDLFDGSEPTPLARSMLDRVAQFLDANRDYGVAIEGHTDDQGTPSYNERVSRERAEAVATYLRARGVVVPVAVRAFAGSRPRVPGTTREARRLNRRVEIVMEPAGDTSP